MVPQLHILSVNASAIINVDKLVGGLIYYYYYYFISYTKDIRYNIIQNITGIVRCGTWRE